METIKIIDLRFRQTEQAIGTFLIETSEGPVLIETGPESTYSLLNKELELIGYSAKDIKHVFVTHIHFDHAGAAWKFARDGARIYVHPAGLPHLASPEKLWNSAAMIYGDDMEKLWGQMQPISADLLIPVDEGSIIRIGDTTIQAYYTPGHAVHHNAYRINDVIFTGDVAGVRIGNGPVVPPCPPPDINIELWKNSLQKLRSLNPKQLYLTHFGVQKNPHEVLHNLEIMLDDWSLWIKPYYDKNIAAETIIPEFMEYTKKQLIEHGLSTEEIEVYEYANPSWMSVAGLLRYWKLKSQKRI